MGLKDALVGMFTKKKKGDLLKLPEMSKPEVKEIEGLYRKVADFSYNKLSSIARMSEDISAALRVIRTEVFREELIWEPKYQYRCKDCDAEYDYEIEACEECNSTKIIEPDLQEKNRWVEYFSSCNEFQQTLQDVFGEGQDDDGIGDRVFIYYEKEYGMVPIGEDRYKIFNKLVLPGEKDDKGKAKFGTVLTNIKRLDPGRVRFNLNETTKRLKSNYRVCPHPNHRSEEVEPQKVKDKFGNEIEKPVKFCPRCGFELLDATFKAHGGYMGAKGQDYFLSNSEVQFYCGSRTTMGGHTKIVPIYKEVLTKFGMNDKLYQRFYEQQLPMKWFILNMDNPEVMQDIVAYLRDSAMKGMPAFTGIRNSSGKGDFAKEMNLHEDSITDLANGDARKIFADVVWRSYGVMPINVADTSDSGGLNNEGLQMKVTDRTTESIQELYHEKVFPRLQQILGIRDWNIKLHPPGEETEALKLEMELKKIQKAQMMVNMGFTAELMDDDFNFKYEGIGERQSTTGGFGDFGSVGDEAIDYPEIDEPEEEVDTPEAEIMALNQKAIEKAFDRSYSFGDGANIYLDSLVKDTIRDGFNSKRNIANIIKDIEKDPAWGKLAQDLGVDKADIRFKLERIVRMENLNLANERFIETADKMDPDGTKYRYKWGGPLPGSPRNSDYSENIMARIPKEGVTLNKLKSLIEEFGDPDIADPDRFITHINQRHSPRRIVLRT